MQCPKCGSSQPVTSRECASCGIIFDRWQPRSPNRKTTASSTPLPPPPAPATASNAPRIPTPFIAVGLFFLIVVGLMWTKHAREAREKSGNTTDQLINQINNSGAKLRSDLQNRGTPQKSGGAIWASSASTGSKMPAGLDEGKIRDIIENCSYFQTDVHADIPKRITAGSYVSLSRATAIGVAAQEHLIEFDPPLEGGVAPGDTVTVKVTQYASAKVLVSDNGDSYRFGLGRRHVRITDTHPANGGVTVNFTWTLDQSDAAALAPEGANPSGGAELKNAPLDGWTLTRAWQKSSGNLRYICQ